MIYTFCMNHSIYCGILFKNKNHRNERNWAAKHPSSEMLLVEYETMCGMKQPLTPNSIQAAYLIHFIDLQVSGGLTWKFTILAGEIHVFTAGCGFSLLHAPLGGCIRSHVKIFQGWKFSFITISTKRVALSITGHSPLYFLYSFSLTSDMLIKCWMTPITATMTTLIMQLTLIMAWAQHYWDSLSC